MVRKAGKVSRQTSVSPTSSRDQYVLTSARVIQRLNLRQCGFTLIELLTVLLIIGFLVGVIAINLNQGPNLRSLSTHAERIMLAVELARQETVLTGEIWGVTTQRDAYGFMRVNEEGEWQTIEARPFQWRKLPLEYELSTRLLGERQSNLQRLSDNAQPHLLIFPNGEVTPFEISITERQQRISKYVINDGIQRTSVQGIPYKPVSLKGEKSGAHSF